MHFSNILLVGVTPFILNLFYKTGLKAKADTYGNAATTKTIIRTNQVARPNDYNN